MNGIVIIVFCLLPAYAKGMYKKITSSLTINDFSRIFQRKISANKLALVGMVGGRAASTIWLKFWLTFCFLTITQMFFNGID